MKVVLSIKPEFAFKIFDGTKKFEFRKAIFKNSGIKTIIVYASSPVQQVIGEFEIERIINKDIDSLWELTQHFSGISQDYFYEYFANRADGFAIEIKNTTKYKQPRCLKADYNLVPPQSFAYYLQA
jgi:predicted transcriptional regulator